jgi:hypothetical protein
VKLDDLAPSAVMLDVDEMVLNSVGTAGAERASVGPLAGW